MELDLLDYTRAYFPSYLFDTAFIDDNYAFGKKGDTLCALIGTNAFTLGMMHGRYPSKRETGLLDYRGRIQGTGWGLGRFVQRIRDNQRSFNTESLELKYGSQGREYKLTFGGDFLIDNGNNHDRLQSLLLPLCQSGKER